MKIKKIICSTLVMGMIAGCLTGCGHRATAESLMEEYLDITTNAESITLDGNIVLAMNVGDSSTTMELKLDGDLKTAIVKEDEENYISKTKTNMTVSMLGVSEKVKQESYSECEDGEITTYTKDLDTDTWTVDYSYQEDVSNQLDNLKEYAGAFELEKKTQKIGKTDCYVLKGTLTGNENMEEMMDEIGMDFDGNEFLMNCTLYMSKDKHEPVRLEMYLDESIVGKEMDFDDYTMSISELSYIIDISKINNTSEINIPDEAKNSYVSDDIEDDSIFDVETEVNTETEIPVVETETTEIETETPETESFEVSNPSTGITGLNSLENENLSFRAYEQPLSYGGTMIYVLGINTNAEDRSTEIQMTFYKNGTKIDETSRYLDLEDGCYDITSVYVEEDYDEIKFNLVKSNVYSKLAGSEIDVDYSFGNGEFFGTITNNTQETISYPQVKFVIWGENKEVLEFNDTYAEDNTLAPGESSTFSSYYDYEGTITDFNFYVTGTVED